MNNIQIHQLIEDAKKANPQPVKTIHVPTEAKENTPSIEAIEESNQNIDKQKTYQELERELKHDISRDHNEHKKRWSNFLMLCMAGMIIFQSVLLGLVGAKIWDFTAYTWLLPALLVQNLAQIIGLAVFVVKALFKDVDVNE